MSGHPVLGARDRNGLERTTLYLLFRFSMLMFMFIFARHFGMESLLDDKDEFCFYLKTK